MRIIPKNTKVKLQFYKGVTITDVALAVFTLAFISLAVTSNLPHKFVIALVIAMVIFPLYIPIGEIRLYKALSYAIKFMFAKKTYIKTKHGKANIASIVPVLKIENNLIFQKDNSYSGAIEIKPIEFNMLSEYKQNYFIDGLFSNILKNISISGELDILKLERPIIFDSFIKNELTRMQNIIEMNENKNLNEKEFRARANILEDRINIIDRINSEEKIYSSSFYIILHDFDKKSLNASLDLIESSLNENNLEAKRLDDNNLALLLKYSYTNDFDERKFSEENKANNLSNIVPNKVQFKTLKVIEDNKQLTHFAITDYPLKVNNAWGQDLFDLPCTKVMLRVLPVEKDKAIKRIDSTINELLSQSDLGKASSSIDKETHLSTLQSLLEGLQNDNETFLDTTIVITAIDELKQNTNKKIVRRKLREMGFKFSELFGRQIDGYMASQITKANKLNIDRGLNSSAIASCFPFVSSELIDENGILIGENKLPTFIDFFKRDEERVNSNMVVIGKSGSGKSFATKTILTSIASDNSKVFILDPENEYGTLAKNLYGKVLDVSSSRDGRINPFHIIDSLDDENKDGTNNSFYSHLQFLEEFFRLILVGINADSLELLNKLILETYSCKNINGRTDLSKLTPLDFPTFQNLAELVDEKLSSEKDEYNNSCLKVLSNYLSKFKKGGRNSALWNGPTTFNPNENFVCFNFQKLLANKNNVMANAQMLLVLKWLDNEVIKNRDYNTIYKTNRKIIVAIDEAHVFIDEKFPIALDFMYNLAKRIRKYDGMQIVITQNVKDFVGSPELARKSSAIINVSQYSLIFSLSPNDMSDLCTLYEKAGEINESESDNIVNLPRGCAFLITGPARRTNIRIIASEKVQETFEKNCQIIMT
ncbi:MAG: DUF87 domain-containing protein [Clostridia bacterium]